MKKIYFPLFLLLFIFKTASAFFPDLTQDITKQDTNRVNELNRLGYESRLTDPEQTLKYADEALELAAKLHFVDGMGEAYRIMGIGRYYTNQSDSAVQNYYRSLDYFTRSKNEVGQAKVLNNIGSLYLLVDFNAARGYFNRSLVLAKKLGLTSLISGLYLNLGTTYQKQGRFTQALDCYTKSKEAFTQLNNPIGLTMCLQNLAIVYKKLHDLEKAEIFAKEAITKAKQGDFNVIVAGTNITLSDVYIAQNRYEEAEKSIAEGMIYAEMIKDDRLVHDFLYISYTLENKRKNYKKALDFIRKVYVIDSVTYINNTSEKYKLQDAKNKQETLRYENEQKQKNRMLLLWAGGIVSTLLAMVVFLLIGNVRKKAQTNKKLTLLNKEIVQQKEDLDRINHNLEEIIDERTRDLKIKNKKLSEYSSHLSHQIRGPVATLKGLLNLEKEGLIERGEVIEQVEKCVNDIDDKILNINEMLHDPQKYGFRNEVN